MYPNSLQHANIRNGQCVCVWLGIVVNHIRIFHCGKSVDNPLNWNIKKEHFKFKYAILR